MLFLASNGYRCIAHDRRGHGRSSQPWNGNEMDTYADDLAALIETLDLKDAVLVGFSTGGGEVARYIGRHGTKRVAKAALIGAVPPLMLKTAGQSRRPADRGVRRHPRRRRSPIARSSSRISPAARSSAPTGRARRSRRACIDSFWLQGMQAGHKNALDCIKAFSETDFTEDLKKFDVPTLIMHGDDDQIVPIGASALRPPSSSQTPTLKVYPGAPHGLAPSTRPGQRRPARFPQGVDTGRNGHDTAKLRGEARRSGPPLPAPSPRRTDGPRETAGAWPIAWSAPGRGWCCGRGPRQSRHRGLRPSTRSRSRFPGGDLRLQRPGASTGERSYAGRPGPRTSPTWWTRRLERVVMAAVAGRPAARVFLATRSRRVSHDEVIGTDHGADSEAAELILFETVVTRRERVRGRADPVLRAGWSRAGTRPGASADRMIARVEGRSVPVPADWAAAHADATGRPGRSSPPTRCWRR